MPGSAQCIANLKTLQKKLDTESKKAVKKWGQETIDLSKSKYCPVDTGRLRSTGESKTLKNTQTEFFVRLSYNTPYAVKQHETPWFYHKVGQWKYLSTPFNYRTKLLVKMIEEVWRKEL